MAQKQISKMQQRRGPLVDLSGIILDAGEIGWAYDERRLFIGNRVAEGAPLDENVEILTERSSITYQYIDSLTTIRNVNSRLRDRASINDFGFSSTDSGSQQTSTIQEAADYLYNPLFATTAPQAGAALFLPANTYTIESANYTTDGSTTTSGVRLYPKMHLVGEGPENTIITSTSSSVSVMETCNNTGGTGANLTTACDDIIVENMTIQLTAGTSSPLVLLKNASNVWFINVKFVGTGSTAKAVDWARDTITTDLGKAFFINCEFTGFTDIVDVTDSTNVIDGIYFTRTLFANSTNGLQANNGVKNFHVSHSKFDTISNIAFDIQTTNQTGHVSSYNVYKSCGTGVNFAQTSYDNVSNFDIFESCTTDYAVNSGYRNIIIGTQANAGFGMGEPINVTFGTTGADTTFLTVASGTVSVMEFKYSLTQNSVERTGRFRIISDGSSVAYDDDYIEVGGTTTLTLKAVMSGTDILVQYNATTNTATTKYRLTGWLN